MAKNAKPSLLNNLSGLRAKNMAANEQAYDEAPEAIRETDDNLWKGLKKIYKKLPTEALFPIDDQPFVLNPAKVEAFEQTIRDVGMFQPIVVRAKGTDDKGNNKYEIISGRHRWKAHMNLGIKEVDCIIIHCSDDQVGLIVNICNQQRGSLTKSEQAKLIESMEKYKKPDGSNYNMKEIADMFGISFKTGYRLMHLLELIEPLRKKVDDSIISVNSIEKLAGSLSENQQEIVNEYIDNSKRKFSEKDMEKVAILAQNNPQFSLEDVQACLSKKKISTGPYKSSMYNRLKDEFGGKLSMTEQELDDISYRLLTEYLRKM